MVILVGITVLEAIGISGCILCCTCDKIMAPLGCLGILFLYCTNYFLPYKNVLARTEVTNKKPNRKERRWYPQRRSEVK